MTPIHRLAIFCGSGAGARPAYTEAAADFGRLLAERGIGLVFGGGSIGMMGIVADTVLDAGGEAIGVIPYGLAAREVDHTGLTALHKTDTMHERKALMADLADGFVALPGGLGTLEELMEVWTWAQLGIHRKPVALLNVAGYYDRFLDFLDHAVAEGFVRSGYHDLFLVDDNPSALLESIAAYDPPDLPRWLTSADL